jgi:hypothetical protein
LGELSHSKRDAASVVKPTPTFFDLSQLLKQRMMHFGTAANAKG